MGSKNMLSNPAQEEIIRFGEGQMMVVACPGSGKTTTILRRIRKLEESGADPEKILMITFTKAAAKEMREKYKKLFGHEPGGTFCTIHSLCLSILSKFTEYDASDLVKDPTEYIYPAIKYDRVIRDKGKFLKEALTDISLVKNGRIDPSEFEPQCCDDAGLFKKIYAAYEEALKDNGLIDFDDLLIKTYEILKRNRDALVWVRERYEYIHVDEYQDVNEVQRDIIYLIAGNGGNLMVVGDDDQSIYGFRGAKPSIMLRFTQAYPFAETVYMSTNYRSDRLIIKKASGLIRNNANRFAKDIRANNDGEGTVGYFSCPTLPEEIRTVADDVAYCVNECGADPSDIAILYRVNAQSGPLAEALSEKKIEFYSNEPIESRYEGWIFSDICAYFRIAHGGTDRKDFIKTVTHPDRWMSSLDIGETGLNSKRMKKALFASAKWDWQRRRAAAEVNRYVALMKVLREADVYNALETLLKGGGYADYLNGYAEFRCESAEEVMWTVGDFLSDIRRWNVKTFDEWLEKANAYNSVFKKAQKGGKGVCLSTMHKSKGLEWDTVFITGCNEGTTPYAKNNIIEDVEEERRLFYVAMTRAKHSLYLYSHESRRGSVVLTSRFIDEAGIRADGGSQNRWTEMLR